MHERSNQMYVAASLYYVQGETMDSIARQLDVSRSTVSRLLRDARETGLVSITLHSASTPDSTLSATFAHHFGVRAHIVPVRDGATEVHRLERVARAAGQLVSAAVTDEMVIGAAWGTTLASVVQYLRPSDVAGTTVVQMNGAASPNNSGIVHVGAIASELARAFSAGFVPFPVPAFFDYPETKAAMWRERSVRHVLELHQKIDLALFGVGSLTAEVPSHVYSSGYLDERDMAQLAAERVVGDVNTVLLREDGSWEDVTLNARASGMTPTQLRRIPRRICIVAGQAKAGPLLGALRAGVATDLVVDDATARAVLART